MKQQMSFAEAEYESNKRVTRRERFLNEMEQVVAWQRLVKAIEPFYPTGQRRRPPIGLERMLRLYFPQQWYHPADEALEDMLYDSAALHSFTGIDLAREGGARSDHADEVPIFAGKARTHAQAVRRDRHHALRAQTPRLLASALALAATVRASPTTLH
jgi:hypothetical protein